MGLLLLLAALPACAHGPSDGDTMTGSCASVPPDESGDGTYYAADGTGNCGFDASPGDLRSGSQQFPSCP
jgi:hypothetical protein